MVRMMARRKFSLLCIYLYIVFNFCCFPRSLGGNYKQEWVGHSFFLFFFLVEQLPP